MTNHDELPVFDHRLWDDRSGRGGWHPIREVDSTGDIGLISAEIDTPYDRSPLSKALWKGKPLDSIWRKTENKGVKAHLGRVVKEIYPQQKRF